MIRTRSLSLLAAVAGLAVPAVAEARLSYVVPGSACQPNVADVSKVNYSSTAGVVNESTSATARVYCPIWVDEEAVAQASAAGNAPQIFVSYVDGSSSANVSCTLNVTLADGTSVSSTTRTSSGVLTSAFSYFPGLANYNLRYSVTCNLPPGTSSSTRSSIRSIQFFTN